MGKVRRTKKKAGEVLEKGALEFHPVPTRRMINLEIDRFKHDQSGETGLAPFNPTDSGIDGAIVKVVCRYRAGDEEATDLYLKHLVDMLRERAHYVRPPKRIAVHEVAKRIEEIKVDLKPIDAAKFWLDKRKPKHVNRRFVLDRLNGYLEEVTNLERDSRPVPASTWIRVASISNFMPYHGEHLLGDIPDGVVGVVGRYTEEEARSNRAGKSAFLDAILFGLFGEARGLSTIDRHIHDGANDLEVSLGLEIGDQFVPIVRRLARGSGGRVKSSLSIGDALVGVKEGNPQIVNLLGMGRDDFLKTCYVKQGDLAKILEATSGELKADIIRWKNLDVWNALFRAVGRDLAKLEEETEELESRNVTAEETIKRGRPTTEELERTELRLKLALKRNEQLAAAESRVNLLRRRLRTLEEIDRCRETVAGKADLEVQRAPAETALEEINRELAAAREAEGAARSESAERRLQAKDGFGGICPVDKGDCPRTDEINADCAAADRRLEEALERLRVCRDTRKAVEARATPLQSTLRGILDGLAAVKRAEEYLEEADEEGTPAEIEAELADALEALGEERIDTRAITEELTDLKARIQVYEVAAGQIEATAEELERCHTERRLLSYLRHITGKTGIPSMMIEDALLEISDQVNGILEELGTEHRLEFQFERELQRPEKTCSGCGEVFPESERIKFCDQCGAPRDREKSDELRPMVREGERLQEFNQDSGGGRDLLALATRVVISRFLGATILFLDEVGGSLDDFNLPAMIRLLRRLPTYGFNQVFVISHQKQIADAMPRNILALRDPDAQRTSLAWEEAGA
jgi:DNA repair exonuclease SbcCD ATPase subunit